MEQRMAIVRRVGRTAKGKLAARIVPRKIHNQPTVIDDNLSDDIEEIGITVDGSFPIRFYDARLESIRTTARSAERACNPERGDY